MDDDKDVIDRLVEQRLDVIRAKTKPRNKFIMGAPIQGRVEYEPEYAALIEQEKIALHRSFPTYDELLHYAGALKVSANRGQNYLASRDAVKQDLETGGELQKTAYSKSGGRKKAENSLQGIAKLKVKADWDRWQETPSDYETQTQFIDDMQDNYPEIGRRKTIEEWCATWNKETPGC